MEADRFRPAADQRGAETRLDQGFSSHKGQAFMKRPQIAASGPWSWDGGNCEKDDGGAWLSIASLHARWSGGMSPARPYAPASAGERSNAWMEKGGWQGDGGGDASTPTRPIDYRRPKISDSPGESRRVRRSAPAIVIHLGASTISI
jgi:hypothetical protein